MVVPVADQERLRAILAFDLQPRIQWAYDLEQDVDGLGAGYVTVGNGDPNGLVTKPEGYLFLDLTTPAVWQNQNGGTVWTQLGAGGGGSGLPDPWTSDQTSGEVTARTDGTDATALVVEAVAGQTAPLLLLKDENGDEAIEGFQDGSINQYLTDPAVIGWLIKMATGQTASPLQIQDVDGHIIFDFDYVNGLISIRPNPDPNPAFTSWYAQSFTNFSESDLLMSVGTGRIEFDAYLDNNDATQNYVTAEIRTLPSQSRVALFVRNIDLGQDVFRVLPSGAIGTSSSEPADGDIQPGECFRWFDATDGAAFVKYKGKTLDGTVVTSSGPMT